MRTRIQVAGALLAAAASVAGGQGTSTRGTFALGADSRAFVVHRPASLPAERGGRALIVMLHGCTQGADDFARGTRMDSASASANALVLYPEQSVAAHPQKCWNWYTPAQVERDRGEAGLLAGMIDSVARAEGVAARHVSLVGISAGAAMAANLAIAYPERYGALVMHSGTPGRSATDVMSGLGVMRAPPSGDTLAARTIEAMGARRTAIPVLVMHGRDDRFVSPLNVGANVRQWTAVNGGKAVVDSLVFDGVGHAWSGGSASGTYTAPAGPDATAATIAFLRKVGALP